MTQSDYWTTVSAAFVGTGAFVILTIGFALIARAIRERFERRQPAKPKPTEAHDTGIPNPDAPDAPVPFGVKVTHDDSASPLFEPAYEFTERETTESGARHELRMRVQPIPGSDEAVDLFVNPHSVEETTTAINAIRRDMPPDLKLAEPPTVEGQTLFTYLKHHAPLPGMAADWDSEGMGVWGSLVETFYNGAALDARIAPKFSGVDMDGLRRHFLRALVTLTNAGLTVKQADDLGDAHAHLRITEEEFDAVTQHLVQTLQAYLTPSVFEHVMPQLSPAIASLRVRIVRPVRVA